MKKISLTRGKCAVVDDADFEFINQFKWTAKQSGKNFYAIRGIGGRKNPKRLWMHREILGIDQTVDHKNGDGLDNRRVNLRPASQALNMRAYRAKSEGKTSRFRGVHWYARDSIWVSQIETDGKRYWVGRFQDEEAAARARDKKVLELGFTREALNFP